MQRILPAPRGSAAGPGGGARRGAGLRLRLGDAHPRPRHARSLGSPEPRGPGAPGSLGRDGALEVGLPRVTAECRLSGPPGPEVAGESRPGSDKLPRHLPDKVSSTSSSSGAGPRREGWGSRPQLPLFSQISAPTSPSRAGPDGYPRPAPRCPAAAASSRPRRGCAGVRATLLRATEGSAGSGAAGVGGCAVRARGSLPGPAVPAANCAWSDGCRCGGKDPWRVRLHPLYPAPRRGHLDKQRDHRALQNHQGGPQGGALPLATSEGARLQGGGYWGHRRLVKVWGEH